MTGDPGGSLQLPRVMCVPGRCRFPTRPKPSASATHSRIHKTNAFSFLLSPSTRLRSCCDPWPRAIPPAVLVWWWPLSRRASPSPMPRATWRRVPHATSSIRTTRNAHAARRTTRPNAASRPNPSPAKTAVAIALERPGARRRERWNVSSPEAATPPRSAPKQTSACRTRAGVRWRSVVSRRTPSRTAAGMSTA